MTRRAGSTRSSGLPPPRRWGWVGVGVLFALAWFASACAGDSTTCPDDTEPQTRETGSIRETWCTTARNVRHGPYQRRDGKRRTIGQYEAGLPDGRWIRYNEKGDVVGWYTLDRGTGLELQWYDGSNAKRRERTLAGGVADGPVTEWYPDGKPMTAGFLRNDRRHGRWLIWQRNGARDERWYQDGGPVPSPLLDPRYR